MAERFPGPLHFAYLGDAVWELHVRRSLLAEGPAKLDNVHRRAVAKVQAPAQAALLQRVEPFLTEEEKAVARRGRNAKSQVPRSVDPLDYRHSTAFECLLGYLYFTGQTSRLQEVLKLADDAAAAVAATEEAAAEHAGETAEETAGVVGDRTGRLPHDGR